MWRLHQHENNVGSCFSEANGHRFSQAPRRPRDDGGASLEAEEVGHGDAREREVRNCDGRMILSRCVHGESLWQTRSNNK
jgi:hypothetical protein